MKKETNKAETTTCPPSPSPEADANTPYLWTVPQEPTLALRIIARTQKGLHSHQLPFL